MALTIFYLLLRNRKEEKPYMMGKVHASSKKSAEGSFLQDFKTPKDWYEEEELADYIKEPHELTEKDKEWLTTGKLL